MSVSPHAPARAELHHDTVTTDTHHQLTEVERHILTALRQIRFGTLEIVVHDSRVVQIEKSEKLRFDTKGRAISDSLS
ncbi:MAG: YezD family protein [Asticcacaulis sp.]